MTNAEKRAKLAERVERAMAASSRACSHAERVRSRAAHLAHSKARKRWLELKRDLEAMDAVLAAEP